MMKKPSSIVISQALAKRLDRQSTRPVTMILPAIPDGMLRAGWDVGIGVGPICGIDSVDMKGAVLGSITSKHPLSGKFGVFIYHPSMGLYLVPSPAGGPGTMLAAKEQTYNVEDSGWLGPVFVESKAGRDAADWGHGENDDPDHIEPHDLKTRSAKRMKASDARFQLEVHDVSIKRLNRLLPADTVNTGIADVQGSFSAVWLEEHPSVAADAWVWVIHAKARRTPRRLLRHETQTGV